MMMMPELPSKNDDEDDDNNNNKNVSCGSSDAEPEEDYDDEEAEQAQEGGGADPVDVDNDDDDDDADNNDNEATTMMMARECCIPRNTIRAIVTELLVDDAKTRCGSATKTAALKRLRLTGGALRALQNGAEGHLSEVFELAGSLRELQKQQTLRAPAFRLATRILMNQRDRMPQPS